MHNEKRNMNILSLVVVVVILIGIVYFNYMDDLEKESTLGTVLFIILLFGSISTLVLYYINAKRDKDDD